MISLITAKPGCGKSQLAVALLVAQVKTGRRCFSDIAGLEVDEIQKRYGGVRVELPPDDFRDAPEGSYIQYDECQSKFPSTGKPGRPDDPVLQALETHRHHGYDIVYITQAPTFVHHHIRKLAGEHKALHRAMGRKGAIVYTWENQIGDEEDHFSRQKANTENFSYSKEWQTLYKSSTIHTHKFKLPSKLIWIAVAIVAVLSWPIYRMVSGQFLDFDGKAVAADAAGLADTRQAVSAHGAGGGAGAGGVVLGAAPSVPAIVGCVGSASTCRCFGSDGLQLDLEMAACFNALTAPLPVNVLKFDDSASGGVGGSPPTASGSGDAQRGQGTVHAPRGTGTAPASVGPPDNASSAVW